MPIGVWSFFLGNQSSTDAPSLNALVAETEALLACFHSLSPSELRTLATNLDSLADYAEQLATGKEAGRGAAEDRKS